MTGKSDTSTAELLLFGRGGETAPGRHDLMGAALRDTLQRLPTNLRLAAMLRMAPDLFLERDAVVPIGN